MTVPSLRMGGGRNLGDARALVCSCRPVYEYEELYCLTEWDLLDGDIIPTVLEGVGAGMLGGTVHQRRHGGLRPRSRKFRCSKVMRIFFEKS
jgi:hypothetical protein